MNRIYILDYAITRTLLYVIPIQPTLTSHQFESFDIIGWFDGDSIDYFKYME